MIAAEPLESSTDPAPFRLLELRLTHPSPTEVGISSEALERMIFSIEDLAELPHPAADSNARRAIRFLATLIPDDVPDSRVPEIVTQVVAHPNLVLEDVRALLEGRVPLSTFSEAGQEHTAHPERGGGLAVSAYKLREIAMLLRLKAQEDGPPKSVEVLAIAECCDVSPDVVQEVSLFMGVVGARTERLEDAAADWYERGGSVAGFAREHGIGEKYAGRLLRQAADLWSTPG